MNTSPGYPAQGSVEKLENERLVNARSDTVSQAAQNAPWKKKACTFILDVADVLKVFREKLVPEIEALAFRLVLLGILFYHIGAFIFNQFRVITGH